MRKDYTALTLAEFCTLVAERNTPTYIGTPDTDKYELRHVNNWRWADSDSADAWQDLRPSRRDYADDADGAEAYDRAKTAWRELEPARVNTDTYTLESTTTSYRVVTISKELYDLFDSVWTKRSRFKGSRPERVGKLTLAGLLKRLDKSAHADVQQQIASAQT